MREVNRLPKNEYVSTVEIKRTVRINGLDQRIVGKNYKNILNNRSGGNLKCSEKLSFEIVLKREKYAKQGSF